MSNNTLIERELRQYGYHVNLPSDMKYSIGIKKSIHNVLLGNNLYLNIHNFTQYGGVITELTALPENIDSYILISALPPYISDTLGSIRLRDQYSYCKNLKSFPESLLDSDRDKYINEEHKINIIVIYNGTLNANFRNKIDSDPRFNEKQIYFIHMKKIPSEFIREGGDHSMPQIAIPVQRTQEFPEISIAQAFPEFSIPRQSVAFQESREHEDRGNYLSKITPMIFISDLSISQNRELLMHNNIHYVINLSQSSTYIHYDGIKYLDINIPDKDTAQINKYFKVTREFINKGIKNNSNVLVHCHAGISRSVTIVVAYLMLMYNTKYDVAYDYVKSKRICAGPNLGFVWALMSLDNTMTTYAKENKLEPLINDQSSFIRELSELRTYEQFEWLEKRASLITFS